MDKTLVLAELKRELGIRQRVYPAWVKKNKLTPATAEHRMAAIAMAIELIEAIEPEAEQLSLMEGEP